MRSFLFLLILVFFPAACSPQPGTSGVIPVPTATRGLGDPQAPETAQPVTAEETLYVFLTAYESNQDEMAPFLSAELMENLPSGGIPELLGFEGTLEGLVFRSGTTAANPNLAIVEARLQVDGVEIGRTFYLERLGNSWLITGVERDK